MLKKIALFLSLLCFSLLPLLISADGTGTVSYKIDGKAFSFKNAVLECYVNEGYISLSCEIIKTVERPGYTMGGKIYVNEGMTIQLAGDEKSFKGEHKSSTSDEMPTYFSWYEIIRDKKNQVSDAKTYLASLDSGEESQMYIILKIDAFGPAGSTVSGSFSGKLFDEDGVLHTVSDGIFSVPRTDITD